MSNFHKYKFISEVIDLRLMAELHKHLLVDATFDNAPTCPRLVEDWLRRLVTAVNMEIFMEPQAKYCDDPTNAGVTGIVVITTSHASCHFWTGVENPYGKLDLYSCKDFSVEAFLEHMKEFAPKRVSYTLVDRTADVHVILDHGVVEY